jgi:hypothetical protein
LNVHGINDVRQREMHIGELVVPEPSSFETKITIEKVKRYTRVYPKVSGLAVWSESCKWYSSLPLDAVVSLFYESVL